MQDGSDNVAAPLREYLQKGTHWSILERDKKEWGGYVCHEQLGARMDDPNSWKSSFDELHKISKVRFKIAGLKRAVHLPRIISQQIQKFQILH